MFEDSIFPIRSKNQEKLKALLSDVDEENEA